MSEPFPYAATVARVHAALKAAGYRRVVRYASASRDGVLMILPLVPPPGQPPRLPPLAAVAAVLPGAEVWPDLGVVWVEPGWGA